MKAYLRQVHSLDGTVLSGPNVTDRCCNMALRMAELYTRTPFTIVAVLNGAVVFATELLRTLSDRDKYDEPVRLEFVKARSYKGTESGTLELDMSILSRTSVEGRHVVLVDDILDSGQTLHGLVKKLREWHPATLRSVVMLRKEGTQNPQFPVEIEPADIGFVIPNKFVVGRGLDYNDRYRNLNWIAEYAGPKE